MPFARVTLINNSSHTADANLELDPGPDEAKVNTPAGQTNTNTNPPPGPFTTITTNSAVAVGTATVHPAAALGGGPNDDIEEVILYVGLDAYSPTPLPFFEFIVAKIVNGPNTRYEVQPLI